MHILFGTAGCHLCDEAQAILSEAGIHYTNIDIMDDDELYTQYGQHIPVFKTALGVIYWPFDASQAFSIIVNSASSKKA